MTDDKITIELTVVEMRTLVDSIVLDIAYTEREIDKYIEIPPTDEQKLIRLYELKNKLIHSC